MAKKSQEIVITPSIVEQKKDDPAGSKGAFKEPTGLVRKPYPSRAPTAVAPTTATSPAALTTTRPAQQSPRPALGQAKQEARPMPAKLQTPVEKPMAAPSTLGEMNKVVAALARDVVQIQKGLAEEREARVLLEARLRALE